MCDNTHSIAEVREAALDDVKVIQDLHHALCRYEYENGFNPDIDLQGSYSPRFAEYVCSRICERTGAAFIVSVEGIVAGYFLGAVSENSKGKRARLGSLFVHPQQRRKGIGQCLVSEFLSWVQGVGAVAVTVAAAPGNTATVNLYRALGFRGQILDLGGALEDFVGEDARDSNNAIHFIWIVRWVLV